MNVLGLSGLMIDGAACLLQDGRVVSAVEEERPVRFKQASMKLSGGLPSQAIELCFRQAGVGWKDIDHVAYFFRPWLEFTRMTAFRWSKAFWAPQVAGYYTIYQLEMLKGHLAVPRMVLARCNGHMPRVQFWGHHLTHAASSYYVSPFDEAAILVMDAVGERDCTSWFLGRGGRITPIRSWGFPHSWGFLYASMTHYLGFRHNRDEYKVMGLAAFGRPLYADQLERVIRLQPDGSLKLDWSYFDPAFKGPNYFSKKFYKMLGPARQQDEPITERHQHLAASLQELLERSALRLVRELHRVTGVDALCIAGGVGLNSTMNGRLLGEGPFRRIFVPPGPHDGGAAMGAALLSYHASTKQGRREPLTTASLGPAFSDEEIAAALEASKVCYEKRPNIAADVADLLARGQVVGWFQGRMEWGPRALGSRSILADPTRVEMRDIVNRMIKHREPFRPFAPSVLAERASEYFEISQPSPFMQFVVPVRRERRHEIPAVVHIDGTARVQTVTEQANPLFWRLITLFGERTGVPMVLNTSFNVDGEPIVCTPQDALRSFFASGLDALAIGNYLVCKEWFHLNFAQRNLSICAV